MPASAIIGAAANIGGKLLDMSFQKKQAQKAYKQQKEFAQHGIQWKVADAQAAGLHPLAALGAQTQSISPVTVGSDFAGMGQDISRAIDATRTPTQKVTAEQKLISSLAIERASLQNDLLRSQIAKIRGAGQSPGIPGNEHQLIPGQPPTTKIDPKAMETERTSPGTPHMTPGEVPDVSYGRSAGDSYVVYPSESAKTRLEDMTIPQTQWSIRNLLMPQPPYKAPPGREWLWNPLTGRHWLRRIQSRGFTGGHRPRAWKYPGE